jgi:RHS repeat-associated protein
MMLYPNGYLNMNQNGEYTKHYYADALRIASKIGNGFSQNLCYEANQIGDDIDPNYLEDRRDKQYDEMMEELTELINGNQITDINPIPYPEANLCNLSGSGIETALFFYHPDHLGSTGMVTNNSSNITQGMLYAPFGEIICDYNPTFHDSPMPNYAFNAKELDEENNMYYYSARYYAPPTFISRDPLSEAKPWMSSYSYCSNSPVNRIDIDGNWDIDVHAYHNRGKNGYAILIVRDRMGYEVYRTVVKTTGTGGRTRNVQRSDTPTGKYKILQYRSTGNKRYPRESYGPNDLLALNYLGGEGGTRNGMHLHGGRQEGIYKGKKYLSDTWGCMRINDDDMLEIRIITDALEANDPLETKGYLTVKNDLKTPVEYSTNRLNRVNAGLDQIQRKIKPYVFGFISYDLDKVYIKADKTRVQQPWDFVGGDR